MLLADDDESGPSFCVSGVLAVGRRCGGWGDINVRLALAAVWAKFAAIADAGLRAAALSESGPRRSPSVAEDMACRNGRRVIAGRRAGVRTLCTMAGRVPQQTP